MDLSERKGSDVERSGRSSPIPPPNDTGKRGRQDADKSSKERRKGRHKSGADGSHRRSKRRHGMSQAARDPRDEPALSTRAPKSDGKETRSPSPVIDFDGLSRPSMFLPLRMR